MLKTRNYFLVFAGFIGSMFASGGSFVYGQSIYTDSSAQFFWVNGGLGVSSVHDGLGSNQAPPSFGLSLCYQSGKSLFSFQYLLSKEFQALRTYSPSETVWDCGILYGRIAKASYGFASISTGISLVGGVRRGRYLSSSGGWFLGTNYYEQDNFVTVGIPVEGQLFWIPLNFLGIGLYGFANLNTEKSFIGALLCIQLGKLR